MALEKNVTTPVGRLVRGSLYKANTTDAEGNALTVKHGPNQGQARQEYAIWLAIPKAPGQTHWAQKPATWDQEMVAAGRPGAEYWGEAVWSVGHAAFPQAAGAADFSWKIYDGDSRQPGKLFKGKPGRAPAENEGWPGHWVLKIVGGYAPALYKGRPGQPGQHDPFNDPDAIKVGYFVQVNFTAKPNGSATSPGVFLNPNMVCFSAFGPEIQQGPDVASAGFGGAPLPPGATMTPPANFAPAQPAATPIPAPGSPPVPAPAPMSAPAPVVTPPPVMAAAPVAAPSYALAPAYITSGHTVDSLAAAAGGHAQALAAGWIVAAAAPAPALPVTPPLPPATSAPVPGVPGAPIAPAGVAPNPGFVAPNPGFVAIPGTPPVPGAAPGLPPAPAVRRVVMNPGQQPYETFKAAGWQDDAIVGQGYGQWAA